MKKLIKIIEGVKKKDVLVVTHDSPDGDAIGSTTGFAYLLKEAGARVLVVHKEAVPKKYHFLTKDILVKDLGSLTPEEKNREYLVFVLDSANLQRVGYDFHQEFPKATRLINIDHHISNNQFGDENFVYQDMAATSEIIGTLYLDLYSRIPKDAATALYTGVMTDTGNLTYESTTSATVALVSILHHMEADINAVRLHLYESDTMGQIAGIRYILNELKTAINGYVVYTKLPLEVINSHGLSSGDLENFIEYPRKVDSCEVAILFKEFEKDVIRVSVRTKEKIDANVLAGSFGGGGHKRAAGFRVSRPMEEAIAFVLQRIEEGIRTNEWTDQRL